MLKKMYHKSPVLIQNIFITIENMFVLYKKFNYIPLFRPMFKIVNEVKSLEMDYKEDEFLEKINEFIFYSINNAEYYNKKKKLFFKLSSISDIEKLPILNKIFLKQNVEQFYSAESNKYNSRLLYTSGSTGSPMRIKVSVKDLQLRYRLILKTMIDFGYDNNMPIARLTGHDICDDNVIFRKDYVNKYYYLSAFHISKKNIQKYFDVINDNNIQALEGYPSAIYTIAILFEQFDLCVKSIKTVYTTAEKLHEYQKEKIEKVLKCQVYDYYGSNEQSILIYTCWNKKLHVSNKTGLLEVLDKNNKPSKKGEVGRMVVTSLTSHFMPLIRYEIGDTCIVSKEQECRCGNRGLIIDEILGRDEDIFKTKDGKYITRFSVVLKYLPKEVIESQLVLSNNKMSAIIYYVTSVELTESNFMPFKEALISKIGSLYTVEYVKVETIPKSIKGKGRAVVIEN